MDDCDDCLADEYEVDVVSNKEMEDCSEPEDKFARGDFVVFGTVRTGGGGKADFEIHWSGKIQKIQFKPIFKPSWSYEVALAKAFGVAWRKFLEKTK